jgi:hypothetical protein
MAYQKLQVGRAQPIVKNDTYNFPNPALKKLSSAITGGTTTQIIDSTADFIALNIQIGDMVYNSTGGTYSVVTGITNATTLTIADAIAATGNSYSIYAYNSFESAVLYVGGAGNVAVETVGGDVVTFNGVTAGQFLPVQVLKVKSTGTSATNIIALW